MKVIKVQEALKELDHVQASINALLFKTKGSDRYNECDECIAYDESDPEQCLLENEIHRILESLIDVRESIKYIQAPIKEVGTLHKNSRGRYQLNSHEFTCGYGIEVCIYDEGNGRYEWDATRIEHDGNDYYAVGHKNVCLEGVKARIRNLSE